MFLVFAFSACGGEPSTSPQGGLDAATGLGGGPNTGGSIATGGNSMAGGASGSAGTSASGGNSGAGGVDISGGRPGEGGTHASGGAISAGGGLATGGVYATGGLSSTGTVRASGGSVSGIGGAGGVGATGGTGGGRDASMPTDAGSTDARQSSGGSTGRPDSAGTGGTTSPPSSGPPETKPLGFGQATTGGGSAAVVEASSLSALQAAIDAYGGSGGLNLRYTGKFDFSTISDPCTQWTRPAEILEIKRKSDITLMGADGSSAHFGIHIASSASNVIVRNMTIALLSGGDASDALTLEGMSGGVPSNIWIDHNTLYSSLVDCAGAGDTSFDGLIDIKKGADNVTVSYNYLHDHQKVSLNGFSDSDTEVRHVTFHHNLFENVGSRTPLQRGGYSHILNNVISGVTTSGINVRMDGYALIEGNFFENVKNPVTSRDSSAIGYWELRGNNITGPPDFSTFGIIWAASSSTPTVDATEWKTTAAFPVPLGYAYAVDAPQCVHDGLSAVAGAGKGLATLKCK